MMDGKLYLYSDEAIKEGVALGMQIRPFVKRVDLIDKNFMSFISHDKEARW